MRRLFLLAVFLPLAAFAGAETDDVLFARGMKSYERSLFVEALSDFTEIVYRSPSSPLADKSRAMIWEIGDRLRKMERRWSLTEEERRGFVKSAETEKTDREKRRSRALDALDRLISRGKKDPDALLAGLGGGALVPEVGAGVETVKLQARLEKARAALKSRKWTPSALDEASGFASLEKHDLKSAVEDWTAASSASPRDDLLVDYLRRVASHWKSGTAGRGFQTALDEGIAHYRAGRFRDARVSLARALALNPDHPEALRYAGLVADRLDATRKARSIGEKLNRSKALADRGAPLAAAALLVEVLELDPGNAEAKRLLSGVKDTLSRRPSPSAEPRGPGAGPAQRKASVSDRAAAEEAYTLGMVHYVQGQPDEALPFFEKAHRLNPNFEEASRALEALRRERAKP